MVVSLCTAVIATDLFIMDNHIYTINSVTQCGLGSSPRPFCNARNCYHLRMPMGTWPSPTTPLDALSFTFVDVETTGLEPARGHRVCEIALLRVQGDHEIARFESLVHPQRPMH